MRIILALPLLALVAGCDVKKDAGNDTTTYEVNQQKIENTANDIGNKAESAVDSLGNAADKAGDRINDKIDNTHINLDVDTDKKDDANSNSH